MDREKLIEKAREVMAVMGVDGIVLVGLNKSTNAVERAFVDVSIAHGIGLMSLVKAEAQQWYVSAVTAKQEPKEGKPQQQPPPQPQQP